ncbi:hypothetical protein Tco_0809991 [Tanacetum coccineum]
MANLPPPNHVVDLPEDDPKEQPELAPKPDHLNGFALHQNPQPEGNMNGWILEDDEEEEEEEEDPEIEEEMEEENDDDDDDVEVIYPYKEVDPLNLPPPDSDTESEDMVVAPTPDDHEQEAEADTIGTITRVPYSVRPFSVTVYVGSRPSRQVFAPGPLGRDVNTLHCQVKGLTQQMFDRANTEHSTLKRLSVMDKYLAEFDTDLRGEIKGQHALRRSMYTLEDQVRELVKGDREENKKLKTIHYRERPYVAPTTPVAHVDRADPDDPYPRPTRSPRHDDPYVMVRDAAAREEGDDADTFKINTMCFEFCKILLTLGNSLFETNIFRLEDCFESSGVLFISDLAGKGHFHDIVRIMVNLSFFMNSGCHSMLLSVAETLSSADVCTSAIGSSLSMGLISASSHVHHSSGLCCLDHCFCDSVPLLFNDN